MPNTHLLPIHTESMTNEQTEGIQCMISIMIQHPFFFSNSFLVKHVSPWWQHKIGLYQVQSVMHHQTCAYVGMYVQVYI